MFMWTGEERSGQLSEDMVKLYRGDCLEVMDRLTYDVSWVHRIHNRALQHLANKQ